MAALPHEGRTARDRESRPGAAASMADESERLREHQSRIDHYLQQEDVAPFVHLSQPTMPQIPENSTPSSGRPNEHARRLLPLGPALSSMDAPSSAYFTVIHSDRAPSVPSLSNTNPTVDGSTVDTDLASPSSGMLLFDVETGVLNPSRSIVHQFALPCTFEFLDCDYSSDDISEWKTHCLSHFRGHAPPKDTSCPLCGEKFKANDGVVAWEEKLEHVANQHYRAGYSSQTARHPEYALFKWLWKMNIITRAEYKDLLGNPLGARPREREPYTVSAGPENHRRSRI